MKQEILNFIRNNKDVNDSDIAFALKQPISIIYPLISKLVLEGKLEGYSFGVSNYCRIKI